MNDRSQRSRFPLIMASLIAGMLCLLGSAGVPAAAQELPGKQVEAPASPQAIAARTDGQSDTEIAERIRSIFSEVAGLRDLQVRVAAGVVTLSGTAPTAEDAESARAIAARVAGVVTVQSEIERDLKVDSNLGPALGAFGDDVRGLVRSLPLIGVALAIAFCIGLFGHLLASAQWLWRKVAPNIFLADLLSGLVRAAFVVLGIIAGLEILGATALLGAVLGGAGVLGRRGVAEVDQNAFHDRHTPKCTLRC